MKEFAYIHDEKQNPSPLRAVPALASFSDDQLDDVLNSSSLLQCEPGDHIIKEGSIDSRIYVLLSGELEVRVGSKKVAAITRIGEVFGELALVNHDKRLASVIASTKAVCLAVDQKFLQDIHPREEDPDFHAALYEFVARLVVRKLEATSRRLAEVEKELRVLRESQPVTEVKATAVPKLKRPVKRVVAVRKPKPARRR